MIFFDLIWPLNTFLTTQMPSAHPKMVYVMCHTHIVSHNKKVIIFGGHLRFFLSFVKIATDILFLNGWNFKLQTMYKLMERKVEMGPFERFKVGSGTVCSLFVTQSHCPSFFLLSSLLFSLFFYLSVSLSLSHTHKG